MGIDKLQNFLINDNVKSVYDYDDLTLQDLLSKFFNDIVETNKISKESLEFLIWLKQIGLPVEVEKELNKMYEDGRLTELINKLSGDVKGLIIELRNEVLQRLSEQDINISNFDNKMIEFNSKILEILSSIQNLNNDLQNNKELINKLNKKDSDIYYVDNLGFDNTGVIDNSDLLNNLINQLSLIGGGIIKFGSGKYRFDKQIIVKQGVIIEGNSIWIGKYGKAYTIFQCYNKVDIHFLVKPNSGIRKIWFEYPEQVKQDSSSPIEYNWTIASGYDLFNDDITLEDIYLKNSYKGIFCNRMGRVNINRIFGNPIYIGLEIEQIKDIIDIGRVEFWTFEYDVNTPMFFWILQNGTGFKIDNMDGGLLKNLFCYGYKIGYHLTGGVWATFVGCTADKCNKPIVVDNCLNSEFIGGSFIGSDFNSTIVTINNVKDSFKIIGGNALGVCSIGVVNNSSTGNIVIDMNFKNIENKIYNAIINTTDNYIYVRSNNDNDIIYGKCFIDGVKNIIDGVVVKNLSFTDIAFSDSVMQNGNGFIVDVGGTISGEKIINGTYRIDNVGELPLGVYYLEFNLESNVSSDRRKMHISLAKDDGSKVFNTLVQHLPMVKNTTKIRVPFYLGEKPYITMLKFMFSYYDELTPTNDKIIISDMKLVKMSNKVTNNTIEYCYNHHYLQDTLIDYNINRG